MGKFDLTSARPVQTPLSSTFNDSPYQEEATQEQILAFQQRTGSIIYPAYVTRPDIAFAGSKLSQHNKNPSPDHTKEAERVIIYLYHTRNLAIESGVPGPSELTALEEDFVTSSDASFADSYGRKSSQGMLINLFGGATHWKASKQSCVTKSTTEAELYAMSSAATELVAMLRLFKQMRLTIDGVPELHCDNAQSVGIINSERP